MNSKKIESFLNDLFNEKIVNSGTFFSGVYVNIIANTCLLIAVLLGVILVKLLFHQNSFVVAVSFLFAIYINVDHFFKFLNLIVSRKQIGEKLSNFDYGALLTSLLFIVIYISIAIFKFNLNDNSEETKLIILAATFFLSHLSIFNLSNFGLSMIKECKEFGEREARHVNKKKLRFYRFNLALLWIFMSMGIVVFTIIR
ncbi:TPA: hypothetical protein ACJEU7_003362 [Acinetobacter baumannii]|uniref:hypothetical protein n=1 Tax=Acinetobacter baumannii TaxID=470 RepID=UPI0022595610|nr:hypothetical protein [Acinetobacter baumannii]MCX3034178.1 hypothetical protein [Acinetobacter baumannii]